MTDEILSNSVLSLLSFAICAKNHFRHQYKGQSYSIMYDKDWYPKFAILTGKSTSEALIFASTNRQYDNRLFI